MPDDTAAAIAVATADEVAGRALRPLEKIGARRPFKRKMLEVIRDRGGFTPILERVASGTTLKTLAQEYGCSPSFMHYLLTFPKGSKRAELYKEARRMSALAHMEHALDIADDLTSSENLPHLSKEQIAAAKLQIEHRRELARAFDRQLFGEPKEATPGLIVNAETLFLRAMQTPLPSGSLPPKEADIIEESHAESEDHAPVEPGR